MLLHIINKSPYEKNSLDSCLKHAVKGSSILLIEDGIYAAVKGGEISEKVSKAMGDLTIYALEPDIKARGMHDKVLDGIKLVDYNGFVELAATHNAAQSWL